MRHLQSQAEQDRDDWGAWLKWTPMGEGVYRPALVLDRGTDPGVD
jgi:hypothetical protein